MYSRSYYGDEASRVTLPENYDGTAFLEREPQGITDEPVIQEGEKSAVEATAPASLSYAGNGRIPFLSSLFGSPGECGLFKSFNLGIEEILILATAAFLFFSKDGDKESALILLLLLFIN